jgi:hypothetical protein
MRLHKLSAAATLALLLFACAQPTHDYAIACEKVT